MERLENLFKKLTAQPWLTVCALILVASFTFNALGAVGIDNFSGFQQDSQQLVLNAFQCQQQLGHDAYSGLLLENTGHNCANALPYYSQSAAPFWLISPFYLNGHIGLYVKLVKLMLAIITALMLITICRRLIKDLRIRYQALVLVLLALSPWLVLFARNLYWLVPLTLAPAWLGWLFYDKFQERIAWFYVILCGLFTLKFLAGYEFITTITISALCPILWCELSKKTRWRQIIKRLAYGIAAAVTALVLAFSMNWAQAILS